MNEQSANPSRKQSTIRRVVSVMAFTVAGLGILGIIAIWRLGPQVDFAIVNIMSFLLSILVWASTVIGLLLSRLPRVLWRSFLLLPVLGLAVFLAFYKFERMDGELSPVFRSRWSEPTALPTAQSSSDEISPELWSPRSTDFPQFLGPNRNGVVAATEISEDWAATPPTIQWKIPIGDGWSGFAIQGDVAVTLEQREEQEWVTCYDVRSGDLLWNFAIDSKHYNAMGGAGPRSTPLISGNLVYAASAVSKLVCLELSSGKEIWSQDLLALAGCSQAEFEARVAWGRSASPLLWNSQIIIPLGGASPKQTLIAFAADDGEELWRAGDVQISYSSPTLMTLAGVEQLLYVTESSLRSFDLEDHRELWAVDWPGASNGGANVSQPLQVNDEQVFLSKGYGQGCQLVAVQKTSDEKNGDEWTTETVWKNEVGLRTKFTSAVLHDGFAYGLSDGILECIDLSNGKRKWKRGRYKQGQVLLVGSKLLITSEQGQIILVDTDPEKLSEFGSMSVIGDVTWNTAALSGNRLLMRNSDEAACVLLPTLDDPSLNPPSLESEASSAQQ